LAAGKKVDVLYTRKVFKKQKRWVQQLSYTFYEQEVCGRKNEGNVSDSS